MMSRSLVFLVLLIVVPLMEAWRSSTEDRRTSRDRRPNVHYHSKRDMVAEDIERKETKKRSTSKRSREIRKKPAGLLIPLDEDDMDNDEVVSVAIGPPLVRPKFEKSTWKSNKTPSVNKMDSSNCTSTNLVKDVLTQLGREFLTHQVSEDFVFGQYVGNAMKNLSSDLKLRVQHEILDIVIKYQKFNRVDRLIHPETLTTPRDIVESMTEKITDKKTDKQINETEEIWPDFNNIAKIVGT